jgi:hypothetical protein
MGNLEALVKVHAALGLFLQVRCLISVERRRGGSPGSDVFCLQGQQDGDGVPTCRSVPKADYADAEILWGVASYGSFCILFKSSDFSMKKHAP